MVAIVAHHGGMGANQRKPVAMLLNRRNCHPPGADRVTALTIRSELPAMQVGVTLRAARRRRREHQAGVTTLASYPLVKALQRETRLPVVIELQLLSNRFPGGARVTVFAADIERPVWISDATGSGILRDRRRAQKCRP